LIDPYCATQFEVACLEPPTDQRLAPSLNDKSETGSSTFLKQKCFAPPLSSHSPWSVQENPRRTLEEVET
jgi:hypothetical protein